MNDENKIIYAMPIWVRVKDLQKMTGVPSSFVREFAESHPDSVRKFGPAGRNGTKIYRLQDFVSAIEGMGK